MTKSNNFDVLIIGADSLIGKALYQRLAELDKNVMGTSRRIDGKHMFFDLADNEKLGYLPFARHVFICAGINGFKACETNIELATKVNYVETCRIARDFISKGSHVIFLSSSSVFGENSLFPKEDSIVKPATEYGRLKALTERQMLNDAHSSKKGKLTIVRLTKVLDSLASLVDIWINKSRLGRSVEAFTNLFLCPISMDFILDSLVKICEKGLDGIIHLSGDQIMSYYDFATFFHVNGLLGDSSILRTSCTGLPERHIMQCASLGMERSQKLLIIEPEILKLHDIKKTFNLSY